MLNSTEQKTLYGLMNMLYPVGSYYITESSDLNTVDKVNAYFGGTWERITDVFLLGAGNSYGLGATGGETTHTLTVAEMPSHTHQIRNIDWYEEDVGNTLPGADHTYDRNGYIAWLKTRASGGDQPHNNMPPYRAVYMYRRKTLATGGYSLEQLLSLLLTKGGEARC